MEKEDNYFHAVGNMHMHTLYSDGEKWHADIAEDAIAAGLDFIIVTDHNVLVQGVEGYYENENGRLLLAVFVAALSDGIAGSWQRDNHPICLEKAS